MTVVPIDEQRRRTPARVPPHDLAAEESLLGALLCGAEIPERITAEDYYKPAHGHIHDAIVDLWARGERPDPIILSDHLRAANLLDAIGGPATLVSLQNATPAISRAPAYANIVTQKALLRRLVGVAGEIAEMGYANPDDAALALEQAEQLVYRLGDRGDTKTAVALHDAVGDYLERLEHRYDRGDRLGEAERVITGYHDLDDLVELMPSTFNVFAGRPAMGKSHWGAALAVNAAETGWPALIVSVEMASDELTERLLARAANIDSRTLRRGNLADSQWPKISEGVGRIGVLPVWIVDDAFITIAQIARQARRIATIAGRPPVIIVDYLQLMAVTERRENRQVEVSDTSAGLKRLAKQLETPVIALAQLSRNVEMRGDKRPQLADLRESGAIENDADSVTFLYRDEYYNPESSDRGIVELHVAKNRHGPPGTIRLHYEPSTGQFRNLARSF